MKENMGRPVINKHAVSPKVWASWTNNAKVTFNQIMYVMRPSARERLIPVTSWPFYMDVKPWKEFRWTLAFDTADSMRKPPPAKKKAVAKKKKKKARSKA